MRLWGGASSPPSGADVHATDKNGVTALHHAVRFRSPVAVKTLLEHGANVNQACRRNGSTPLHRAVTLRGGRLVLQGLHGQPESIMQRSGFEREMAREAPDTPA